VHERITLKSGRTVFIRPISPEDGPRLRAAYDRLSPESKYRRFLAPKPHLSTSETRYLVHIDGRDHVALVATPAEDQDLIIAVARFVRLDENPTQAEFAVVVGDPFQQEGLATALMERLGPMAARRGITSFRATMLAENTAAHRLVRGFATTPTAERHLGSVNEIEVELGP
jgi:RimJ/RimL family protein N-acetyltransferase